VHFKKLEIFGFKSFADRITLNFEPGITAVVGPNGCGKSNVFDSIRWVLGEQSMKELRGASREDVIFNGTEKKPSLGFAEVNLTLSNENRALAIEYDEVTITRRLYRSGESEYQLNKTNVRLRDIQELLMGTGIGAEAYSMIQQGKVDLVVSAKPEERRLIFDEASGVSKYKARKKEALSKLKSTEENLLRINDIVVEVKRQILSVERQAQKAQKYKDVFEDLKEKEMMFASVKLREILGQKDGLGRALAEMKSEEDRLKAHVHQLKEELQEFERQFAVIDAQSQELHEQSIKLAGQAELDRRQMSFYDERIQSIDHNAVKFETQKKYLLERCHEHRTKLEELTSVMASLQSDVAQKQNIYAQASQELQRLEQTIEAARAGLQADEDKQASLTSRRQEIKDQLSDIARNEEGVMAQIRRLDMDERKFSNERLLKESRLRELEGEYGSLQTALDQLRGQKQIRVENLSNLKAEQAQIEKSLQEAEKQQIFLISQKEFIEKLQSQYTDIPDPVTESKFITAQRPLPTHSGIISRIKEVKEIKGLFADAKAYEVFCESKFIEWDPQQISGRIEKVSVQIQQCQERRGQVTSTLRRLQEDLDQSDAHLQQSETSLSVLQANKGNLQDDLSQITGEYTAVQTQLTQLRQEQGSFSEQSLQNQSELIRIQQELVWHDEEAKEREMKLQKALQDREQKILQTVQLKSDMDAAEQKIQTFADNQKLLNETLDQSLGEIAKIDRERESDQQMYEELLHKNQQLQSAISGMEERQKQSKLDWNECEERKTSVQAQLQKLRSQMASQEGEIQSLHDGRHHKEFDVQQMDFQAQTIIDRLQQTYKVSAEDLQECKTEEGFDIKLLEDEIKALREKCEGFGGVNLGAMEECEELKGRFEFLTQQQADLIEARSQLLNTVQKINKSTHQMFMDSFNKVCDEFRTYFRILFGGGEAQLILLDPENVLDSGIDIVARPPGKKLQSISLMSGGEKTLTAIALVFAVFKVNPSPFCVLDEIDAALDDANVDRFVQVLKEFAKFSQFIVITHNKSTMAVADVLYGVTMPETGVSRTVSVKFTELKEHKHLAELVA